MIWKKYLDCSLSFVFALHL